MSELVMNQSAVFAPRDTLRDRLVSIFLWWIGALWAIPTMTILAVLWTIMDVKKTEWLTRIQCRVQVALTGCRLRSYVHPDVDDDTPYLFLQNHTNHFDYATMAYETKHYLQGVELEKHFKYPVYGWFMKARGTVPIKQGKPSANRNLTKLMKAELDKGMSILMFPEGTRTLDGHLGKLRRGAFHMAIELGAPIVPVAVTGMYETMRKGSLIIRPGFEVTVYIEKPIPTEGLQKKDVPELMEKVRLILHQRIEKYWEDRRS